MGRIVRIRWLTKEDIRKEQTTLVIGPAAGRPKPKDQKPKPAAVPPWSEKLESQDTD